MEVSSIVRLGLISGVTGLLVALSTTAVAVSTSSVTTAVVVRAGLVSLLLFLASRAVVTKLITFGQGGRVAKVAVAGLALGYVIDLAWWGGHAYVAQLFIGQPLLRVLVDGLLWVGVGCASVMSLLRRGQGAYLGAGAPMAPHH